MKSFHANTLKSLAGIVGAVGVDHPHELRPYHIARRVDDSRIKLLSEHYFFIEHCALLRSNSDSGIYNKMWDMAQPGSFSARLDTNQRTEKLVQKCDKPVA